MTERPPHDVTVLLSRVSAGDESAPGKLLELVYDDLRHLAGGVGPPGAGGLREPETSKGVSGRERQILASLSHPHIAKLLDGGVSDAVVVGSGLTLLTFAKIRLLTRLRSPQ